MMTDELRQIHIGITAVADTAYLGFGEGAIAGEGRAEDEEPEDFRSLISMLSFSSCAGMAADI